MENGFRKASAHSERARLSKWKKVLLSKALKENKAFKCIEKKGCKRGEEERKGGGQRRSEEEGWRRGEDRRGVQLNQLL